MQASYQLTGASPVRARDGRRVEEVLDWSDSGLPSWKGFVPVL